MAELISHPSTPMTGTRMTSTSVINSILNAALLAFPECFIEFKVRAMISGSKSKF
jgi:hypothetical protein